MKSYSTLETLVQPSSVINVPYVCDVSSRAKRVEMDVMGIEMS